MRPLVVTSSLVHSECYRAYVMTGEIIVVEMIPLTCGLSRYWTDRPVCQIKHQIHVYMIYTHMHTDMNSKGCTVFVAGEKVQLVTKD